MGTRQQDRPQRRTGAVMVFVALVSIVGTLPAAHAALPGSWRAASIVGPVACASSRPSVRVGVHRLAEVGRALPRNSAPDSSAAAETLGDWDRLRRTSRAALGGSPSQRPVRATSVRPRRVSRRDSVPRTESIDRRALRRWQRLRAVMR